MRPTFILAFFLRAFSKIECRKIKAKQYLTEQKTWRLEPKDWNLKRLHDWTELQYRPLKIYIKKSSRSFADVLKLHENRAQSRSPSRSSEQRFQKPHSARKTGYSLDLDRVTLVKTWHFTWDLRKTNPERKNHTLSIMDKTKIDPP